MWALGRRSRGQAHARRLPADGQSLGAACVWPALQDAQRESDRRRRFGKASFPLGAARAAILWISSSSFAGLGSSSAPRTLHRTRPQPYKLALAKLLRRAGSVTVLSSINVRLGTAGSSTSTPARLAARASYQSPGIAVPRRSRRLLDTRSKARPRPRCLERPRRAGTASQIETGANK